MERAVFDESEQAIMWGFLSLVAVLIFVAVLSALPFVCIGFLVWVLAYGLGLEEEEENEI